MAVFTTESAVRLRFQVADTTLVPTDLIESSINEAHEEILRRLDETIDTDPPETALVMGETLLAGARLFESLASQEANTRKAVSIGGQRVEDGNRFRALTAAAALAEKQAWYLLEPYLADLPAKAPLQATDTVPVLGEE